METPLQCTSLLQSTSDLFQNDEVELTEKQCSEERSKEEGFVISIKMGFIE